MGNSEDNMDVDALNSSGRVRQYPVGHKGPYTVIIRRKDVPLESKKINNYVFTRFKHVLRVSQENEHKIKIIFGEKSQIESAQVSRNADELGDDNEIPMSETEKNKIINSKIITPMSDCENIKLIAGKSIEPSAREEANELPKYSEWNKKYYVYVPEKLVECKGVISWPVGNDVKEIIEEKSTGKFGNPLLNEINVLEAVRLKRKSDNASSNEMEDTGTVIVTFEGLVLPKWVNFNNMLVPVREFRAKPMFCKRCLKYFHTEKRCNNKKATTTPEIKCVQCNSSEHESGSKECPKRKIIEKKVQKNNRQNMRKTYAELLRELDPNSVMPNESETEGETPPMTFPSRRIMAAKRKTERDSQPSESPQRKRRSTNEQNTQQSPPPGFPRQVEAEESNEFADLILDYVKSMINDMELPPFIKVFIDNKVVPYIHKQIVKFTNSVLGKFNLTS